MLILAGDDDPIVKTSNQHIVHRRLRDARLEVIDDAGHVLLLESPDEAAPLFDVLLQQGSRP